VADGRSSDDGCDGDFHVQVALSRRRANRGRKNGSRCCSTRPARRGYGSSFARSRHAPLTSGRKSEASLAKNELDRGCSETTPSDRTVIETKNGD
jgi:hypothetical protein